MGFMSLNLSSFVRTSCENHIRKQKKIYFLIDTADKKSEQSYEFVCVCISGTYTPKCMYLGVI